MDEEGKPVAAGSVGEVVIRGRNVTRGYENNPEANAKAFTHGWFRTGDEGVLDEGGYLRLTGRLKEMINRGGEKVSPIEIDTVLMDHPAVAQVVTFALPHPTLGEDVAAAVVLRENVECNEHVLREFASARLAGFKVPRKFVFISGDSERRDRKAATDRSCRKIGPDVMHWLMPRHAPFCTHMP